MKNFIIKFWNIHYKECHDIITNVSTKLDAMTRLREKHGQTITILDSIEL